MADSTQSAFNRHRPLSLSLSFFCRLPQRAACIELALCYDLEQSLTNKLVGVIQERTPAASYDTVRKALCTVHCEGIGYVYLGIGYPSFGTRGT